MKNRQGEVIVEFKQPQSNFIALKLDTAIGTVGSFKYFEVDILENSKNSNIWIGIWEEEAFKQFELPDIHYQNSRSTVILDGKLSSLTTKYHKKMYNEFKLQEFGDIGGILISRYVTSDNDILLEITPTCNGSYWINSEMPEHLRSHPEDDDNDDSKKKQKENKKELEAKRK